MKRPPTSPTVHGSFPLSRCLLATLATAATFIAVSCAAEGAAEAAPAGNANGLGEKGELIISADRLIPLFNFTRVSATETQNGIDLVDSRTGTGISLLFGRNLAVEDFTKYPVNVHTLPRIAFDYTIIPKLTLGAALAFGFGLGGSENNEFLQGGNVKTTRTTDAPRATAVGIAPRVGYIFPFSDILAFWPRLGFGFYSVSAKQDQLDNNGQVTRTISVTDTLFSLDLDPQLVIIPTEHFFFHVGPLINIPLSGRRSYEVTTGARTDTVSNDVGLFHFGITAGLGGWINL